MKKYIELKMCSGVTVYYNKNNLESIEITKVDYTIEENDNKYFYHKVKFTTINGRCDTYELYPKNYDINNLFIQIKEKQNDI